MLAALAGARRTDTAVARFLAYAGPFQGQVAADPATMDKIAALPGLAYSQQGALLLVEPVSVDGRPAPQTSVITEATITHPSQSRAIILAGRYPLESRADEVALNESAAQELHAHVGSLIQMAGYRPDQTDQVMNGTTAPPDVTAGNVRVTGIVRLPTDLTADLDAPADVTYVGQGDILATAAFFERNHAAVGNFTGISFQLTDGTAAGLQAFEAQVKRVAGSGAQVELGDDNAAAGAFAQRGTTLEALALLVFGSSWRWRCSWSWGRASSARRTRRPRTSPRCGRLAPSPAAGRGRAGAGCAGRRGRDGAGGSGRLRAVGVHADRAGAPGGGIPGALVRRRGRARRGRGARAAARRARGARGTAGGAGGRPRGGGRPPRRAEAGLLTGRRLSAAAVSGIRLAFQPGRGRAAVAVARRRSPGWWRRSPRCSRRWCSAPACRT